MWAEEMSVARRAAQSAGQILKQMFGKINQIEKKGETDLVTEADRQSEKAIMDIITRHFPSDTIYPKNPDLTISFLIGDGSLTRLTGPPTMPIGSHFTRFP